MRKILSILGVLGLSGILLAIEPKPVGSGETCDLPAKLHIRNVGGSDGAGLCVFTSGQHASIWQNIEELNGFREWMRTQPGGGWPEKFDACVSRYCKIKGRPVPAYIQHTGGDEEFLEATLRTSRIVCVTYAGRDDFYRGETIAHMVNLVYLSATEAAILDNNRPGEIIWMTRKEFLDRWRGLAADGSPLLVRDNFRRMVPVGGGWGIAFLAPPPTPRVRGMAADDLVYGGKCKCADGCGCGNKESCYCAKTPGITFGQCANGQCRVVPVIPDPSKDGWEPTDDPEVFFLYSQGVFKGRYDKNGWHGAAGAGLASGVFVATSELPEGVDSPMSRHLTGVVHEKLNDQPSYVMNGNKVTRRIAFAALTQGILDDTGKWHVAFVGELKLLTSARLLVETLPPEVRGKLLIQFYSPDSFVPKGNGWTKGVFLMSPTDSRTSDLLGSADDIGELLRLLSLKGGPLYVEPKPIAPVPDTPDNPAPATPKKVNYWIWAVVAGILLILINLRKKVLNA